MNLARIRRDIAAAQSFPFDRNIDEQSRTLLTIKPQVVGRTTEHPSILYLGGVVD